MTTSLLHNVISLSKDYPQLVVFLALTGGYLLGRFKFRGFSLGNTASVLLVALFLGQIGVNIPTLIQSVSFGLFIFTIGYQVGPEFFGSVKKNGMRYILLSLFVACIGLLTATLLGKIFSFDKGLTAGLLGGAMTQSSIIGTADGAIRHLVGSHTPQALLLKSHVAIAYAITYLFGTAGLVIFFKFLPNLMRIDLKAEAKKLETSMSGDTDDDISEPELFSWRKQLALRIYRVHEPNAIDHSISRIETYFQNKISIDNIERGGTLLDMTNDTTIQLGDIIAVIGPREALLKVGAFIGPEIDDSRLDSLVGEIVNVCVLNKEAVGQTLATISQKHGHACFLRRLKRQGHKIPLTPTTILKHCDVLEIAGERQAVEHLIEHLGYPERPTNKTNLATVGLGCLLGTLLGLISLPIAGIPITLGIGGGILVAGLLFGWLRTLHPSLGVIPDPAQWLLTDLGLNLFIACVGLTAAPQALHALHETGFSLFFAGIILTLTPMILGLCFGRWVLKLNPVLLFGAMTGAGTATAALNAVKEEADSAAPTLGYTVPYAFGNVLLTVFGALIVHLVS